MQQNGCRPSSALKESLKTYMEFLTENHSDVSVKNEASVILEHMDELNFCSTPSPKPIPTPEAPSQTPAPAKKVRRKGPKSKFLSYCMRGPDKGGLGKPLAECHVDWKALTPEQQAEFNQSSEQP